MLSLPSYRTLLLDTAFEPLMAVGWQRAMLLSMRRNVEVLECYDRQIRSATASFALPAVVRMPGYFHRRKKPLPATRANVALRDDSTCQYCRRQLSAAAVTLDHVLPSSRGGGSEWTNLVAACAPCNRKKGNRTPREAGMPLAKEPVVPSAVSFGRKGMFMGELPTIWLPYLPVLP